MSPLSVTHSLSGVCIKAVKFKNELRMTLKSQLNC